MKPARAWVEAFDLLRLALSLSVITTVAAFLSNAFSPIIPLRAFGITLAIGVVCAFTASTITVGAIHVVSERSTGRYRGRKTIEHSVWRRVSRIQDRSLAKVVSVVAILTLASAAVSVGKLETSFELTDFLSEDEMEVMEVRDNLYESYQINALKSVYILVEPKVGEDSFGSERELIEALSDLEDSLPRMPGVVVSEAPGTSNEWPSYDSIYLVIGDAIEQDPGFGEQHNMEVFGDDWAPSEDFVEGDFAGAISSLITNHTIGDQLRGDTWSERTSHHASLNDQGTAIQFLRIRIDVEAENSAMVDLISLEMQAEASIVSEDTGGRAYAVGDLMTLSNVLSGLISSIVSSTAISLAVSLMVLAFLTRKVGQSLLVILPVGLAGVE